MFTNVRAVTTQMVAFDRVMGSTGVVGALRDDEPAFAHIVRLVRTALNVPYAAVVLCAPRSGWARAINGLTVTDPSALHPLCVETMGGARGVVFAVDDVDQDPRFQEMPEMAAASVVRSFVGVPLILASGENLGVLYAADVSARSFLAGECSMLSQLGDCVIRELELRQRAASDDLTGFLTRKPFFDALEHNLTGFMADGTPASVAILDLDHFKTINDRFGHATGDHVLSCVANVSRAILSDRVSLGRLGGEEFGFVFPNLPADDAAVLLCELREAIEAIRLPGVPDMMVTGSIGVAGLTNDIATVSAWCKMADAALYGAKQAGRNCVIVSRNTRALPPERHLAPVLVHRPTKPWTNPADALDGEANLAPQTMAKRTGGGIA